MPESTTVQVDNSRIGRVRQQIARYHQDIAHSPFLCIIIGVAVLASSILAMTIDIATSEGLVSNNASQWLDWSVWTQPYVLFTTRTLLSDDVAIGYAFILETIQLVVGLVMGHALAKLSLLSPRLAKVFMIFSIILVLLNGVATFHAAPSSNFLVQLLVSIAIGGWSVCGLPIAIGLLESGIDGLF